MLVDNPLSSNFSFQPSFEDFFNMDLISGPSSGTASSNGGSSSRSSSGSPSQSFQTLPPTPPNPFTIPDPSINSYFNFLDDDFASTKVDPLAPPPTTAAPFDFFAPYNPSSNSPSLQSTSPDSAIASSSSPSATDSPLAIDPQLVGTPAQSKAMSEFDEDEEDDDDDAEDHDLNDLDNDAIITPVKVGGRGKAARKGTVQSGGVVKKSSGGASAADRKEKYQSSGILTTTSTEPNDWRPTPEEYKKMSSKEKRQLRNKISARNFRVRRKEYITTLEGDIAERDRLIDCIRTELTGTKSENVALRQEIATLKKALLEGRGLPTTPVLPPPAPLPEIPAAVLASASSPSASPAPKSGVSPPPKSPLVTANTRKDLPTSPRIGARNFWGGASAGMNGFGGITPVHTTLIPEWGSVLSGKAQNAYPRNTSSALQENINPLLNGVTSTTLAGLGYLAQHQAQKKDGSKEMPGLNNGNNVFDSFADKNLFTLKSMEEMGQQQSQSRQLQQHLAQQALLQQSQSPQPPSSQGLASGIRPHYFTKQSPALSALLSGKAAASSYPTPPPSPPMRHASTSSSPSSSTPTSSHQPTEQQALLATLASQTLVRKLGSAFWDAFSGSSASSPLANAGVGAKKEWDADKVRKVLEGKAVVRVVDVDSLPSTPAPLPASSSLATTATVGAGAISSSGIGMGMGVGMKEEADKRCGKPVCFTALEEKLKNLHL